MDLIRAGLQDLDKARALFDQLKADDIPDERCAELLSALAHACDPDMALSNFVDIVNAMQSSQRDLEHVIPDNDALKRLVTCSASPTRWASSCASTRSLWRRQQSTTATAICSITRNAVHVCSRRSARTRTNWPCPLPPRYSGRSGHGSAFQLPEPTGRHHRPGRCGGRPDLHPTDHQPRTVRPRGRGA